MPDTDVTKESIKQIYASSPKPLLLSTLGYELRKKGCIISGGIKQFIENSMDNYVIVQHDSIKEKVAISSIEDQHKTFEMITSNISKEFSSKINNLILFPRSLMLAFCSHTDKSSFITTEPPYSFYQERKDGINLIEIKQSDKIDIFIPSNIRKIDNDNAILLYDKITEWCHRHGLDMLNFTKKSSKEKEEKVNYKTILPEILIKFIDAQPDYIKKQLVIPLDLML